MLYPLGELTPKHVVCFKKLTLYLLKLLKLTAMKNNKFCLSCTGCKDIFTDMSDEDEEIEARDCFDKEEANHIAMDDAFYSMDRADWSE
jgi:hypothetical protein